MSGFHAILSDHFSTLTFCTFSNSKMNVFGDSDFFVQNDTYFPYIYLTFWKRTHTGFIEKRPIFQVFGIFRQLQKIPDAQFQSGSHLSGATQIPNPVHLIVLMLHCQTSTSLIDDSSNLNKVMKLLFCE